MHWQATDKKDWVISIGILVGWHAGWVGLGVAIGAWFW